MRRPLVASLLLSVSMLALASFSHALPRALRYAEVLGLTNGGVTVPPEWDGVWASQDSVYDCQGGVLGVESYLDTLCAGQVLSFADEDPTGGTMTIVCNGTATAVMVDVTCTGSAEVIPDCTVLFSMELDGVRSGDTFTTTSVTNISYSGTAFGCDLLPPDCTRVVTRATRIGPAPADYCATPARGASWGEVKVRYR